MARLAPSLVRLWGEVNGRWPHRDHWSDGWLGDDSHATRFSDHNPDEYGWVHATDTDASLDHKMGPGTVGDTLCGIVLAGCRSGRLARVVNYVIYKGRIYSSSHGYRARIYTGTNQHESHVHVSVFRTDFARQWSGVWGVALPTIDTSKVAHAFSGNPASAPNNVARVQERLVAKGFLKKPYHKGRAGRKTKNALKAWQRKNSYVADGVPGISQLRKLAGVHYRVVP